MLNNNGDLLIVHTDVEVPSTRRPYQTPQLVRLDAGEQTETGGGGIAEGGFTHS